MWDLEHSGSLDSKDLLLFTTSCKFRGDCSAFPLREFLKVLHTRTLEHPIPRDILAVVLPLGQAFAFTVSTGLLASSTMGETAHLTSSSCHFWETVCARVYTWAAGRSSSLAGSTQSTERQQRAQELCERLQSLVLRACYVKPQSLLAGCDKSVSSCFPLLQPAEMSVL